VFISLLAGKDKPKQGRVKILAQRRGGFSARHKKTPCQSRQGVFYTKKRAVRSAAGASTGAGAATAATAEGVSGIDREPRAVTGVDEIDLDLAASLQQTFVHKELQTTFFKYLIAVFWLIQSQSK
jgi:hypothetical protein